MIYPYISQFINNRDTFFVENVNEYNILLSSIKMSPAEKWNIYISALKFEYIYFMYYVLLYYILGSKLLDVLNIFMFIILYYMYDNVNIIFDVKTAI